MSEKLLPRRTVLKGMVGGAAVAFALPPLEAMIGSKGAYAEGELDGPFFALFFWANGLPWHDKHGPEQATQGRPDLWTPAEIGAYTPTELLSPLARHQVSVATGLEPTTEIPPDPPGQGDGHMRGFMVGNTGDRPRSEGFNHASHTLTALRASLDQYIARHPSFYASAPRFHSLIAGASEARFHDYGHWNAISYNGPFSTNQPVMTPGALFDYVFAIPGDADDLRRRSKALDAVLADARSLRDKLGMSDRARLEQHLDHLAELQHRLDSSNVVCAAPARPADGGTLHERTAAMAQIMAVAVSCGLTRVLSFMLTSPATTHIFTNLGVADGMHKVCHDGGWDSIRAITSHHMEAFAIFLDAFANIPLPTGGTLLDRGVVLGTSEYGEGWFHGTKEFPIVIAGGGNGKLRRGIHERAPGESLSRAHLTVLRSLGLPDQSFGFNGGETSSVLSGMLV